MKNGQRNIAAIIGGGRISEVHAEILSRYHPNTRIKYVADPYVTPAIEAWCEKFGVENVIKDADVIFADSDVDCVFVCSPTPTHGHYIFKACETGKNVYCEKPLEQDISTAKKVISAVEESGIKFLMGFMRRFDKNQRRMKAMIKEGKIGAPHIIKLCSRDPEPPGYTYIKSSGGIYMDSMTHDFDLVRYFSNSEIKSVYALGAVLIDPKIGELEDVDTAVVSLELESGALGVIDLSRQSNCGYDQRVEVHGEKGTLKIENVHESTVLWSNNDGITRDKPLYFFLERYYGGFIGAQEAFFRLVNQGEPALVSIYDGLAAMRISQASRKSYEERRLVLMSEIP